MIEAELAKGAKLLQDKQLFEACDFFERLVQRFPKDSRCYSNLAVSYMMAGERSKASPVFLQAVKLSPKSPDLWYNYARCLVDLGNNQDAIKALQQCLNLNPRFAQAHTLVQQLQKASVKQQTPQQVSIPDLYQVAVRQFFQRNYAESERCLRRILLQDSQHKDTLNLLGAIHYERREFEPGLAIMSQLAERFPDDSSIICNLGKTYSKMNRSTEANATLRKAIEVNPDNDEARRELAFSLNYSGLGFEALEQYEHLFKKNRYDLLTASNLVYLLTWLGNLSPEELTRRHREVGDVMSEIAAQNPLPKKAKKPQTSTPFQKIRLGYISPDFRFHSVHLFLEGVIESQDRTQFEVFLYGNVESPDAHTEKYKSIANYRDISRLTDREAALLIQQEEIDVLVDLAGHTAKSRLAVLAYKPAPIQVCYLGYPVTTGLKEVDYFICDEFCDPYGEHDEHFVEKLIRLDRCKYSIRPKKTLPDVAPLPSLSGKPFTFGCFNNPSKYNDGVIQLWAELLNAVPDSRLLLKSRWFQDTTMFEATKKRFRNLGGDSDRLLLIDFTETTEDMDMALDPFPFNGATATLEAIWMGLPVLTLVGETHASRRGFSIMSSLNLTEFCAHSKEEFIRIAKDWSTRREELSVLRSELRERMRNSPLCDQLGLTRKLESAFVEMLKERSLTP